MKLTRPRAVLIIILVLTLLVLGLNSLSRREAQPLEGSAKDKALLYATPAAENLLAALAQNDFARFGQNFAPQLAEDFQLEDFAQLQQKLAPLGEFQQLEVEDVRFDHGVISAYYNVQYAAGLANLNLTFEPDGEHRITRLAVRLAVPVTPTP